MKSFGQYHPVILFMYFAGTMVITLLSLNPIILGISFVGAFLFCSVMQRPKLILTNLAFYIPMFVLISVTNPIFSHNGKTILFFLNGNRVTLEAIFYGMAIAGMIISVFYWCKCYNEVVTSDKFLYLFGRIIPKGALVISSALKFVPLFKQHMKKVSQTQKALGLYSSNSIFDRLKSAIRVFGATVTWAFENSIETADSMKARGYGLKGRTSFSLFKFYLRDGIMLVLTFSLLVTVIILAAMGFLSFGFYPTVSSLTLNAGITIAYVCAFLFCIIPTAVNIKESLSWKIRLRQVK